MGCSGMEQVVTDRKDCTRQAGRQADRGNSIFKGLEEKEWMALSRK